MKTSKYLSGFLGLSMLILGLLKFIEPFQFWYLTQVETSELPYPSYALGILGELLTGALLLLTFIKFEKISIGLRIKLVWTGVISILGMMAVAVYVHMHPAVPEEVLPLKIKPPFIPIIFGLIAVYDVYAITKSKKSKS